MTVESAEMPPPVPPEKVSSKKGKIPELPSSTQGSGEVLVVDLMRSRVRNVMYLLGFMLAAPGFLVLGVGILAYLILKNSGVTFSFGTVVLLFLLLEGSGLLVIRRGGKRLLMVTLDGITLTRAGGGFSVKFTEISRLVRFRNPVKTGFRGLSGRYFIETEDGQFYDFEVLPDDHDNPGIERAMHAIEVRKGMRWVGMEASEGGGFREFLEVLKKETRASSYRAFINWAGHHAYTIRAEIAGVGGPLFSWAFLMVWAAGFFLAILVLYPLKGFWPLVIAGLAWVCICLGINILLILVRSQVRLRETVEEEVGAARKVQEAFLPHGDPVIKGYSIAGVCQPALEVAGDYYDYLALDNGSLGMVVADVSGKGLSSGLLMTLTKGALTASLHQDQSPATTLNLINREIHNTTSRRMFVTMVLAILDPKSSQVDLVRAGHNPPLLVPVKGEPRWIHPNGLALGIDRGPLFKEMLEPTTLNLAPGEILVIYSDGLTEAMDQERNEFSPERLLDVCAENRQMDAQELRSLLLERVTDFRAGAAPNDDLTLVVLKKN